MKTLRIKYRLTLLATLLLSVLASCIDDFDRMGDTPYVDGIADIAVELTYEAESSRSLTSRSYTGYENGEDGDKISNIKSLVMLIYEGDNLAHKYIVCGTESKVEKDSISNIVNSDNQNNIESPSSDSPTDDKTGKVTFNLKLQSGENYYIYAVANMGDMDDAETLEAIKTRDGLKSISRKWDTTTLANNSEMFGIFSLNSDRNANDDSPLVISALTKNLHCWVRRLASKVTVAFDGSELYDGVEVFVTDIYLKDIPQTCYLGKDNTAGKNAEGGSLDFSQRYNEQTGGLIADGGSIKIQTLPENKDLIIGENYAHLCCNEHPYLGAYANNHDKNSIDNTHVNTAPSLFFYENMQGKGKSKHQDALDNSTIGSDNVVENPDNKIDFPDPEINVSGTGWKDEKPFGTYVEVKGYYRSALADGHISSGPITYRFMLGQDVDKDYNATRNTHYQLTLAFKGYGNDADWHIEYEEKRGLYITSPQYISYLYNKSMVATVKVVGKMTEGSKLVAHIVDKGDNDFKPEEDPLWRPWGDNSESFPKPPAFGEWPGKPYYFIWDVTEEGAHQAFLSLRKTTHVHLPVAGEYHKYDKDGNITETIKVTNSTPSWELPLDYAIQKSKDYYYGNFKGDMEYEQGVPNSNEVQTCVTENGDKYTVFISKRDNNGTPIERIYKIPLYTRAKELVTRTGFTGNNPYYSYARSQRVKFTVSLQKEKPDDPATESFYLRMIQVRRILNPKGIWRAPGSTKRFHVRLLRLERDETTAPFESFESVGSWSAEILSGGDDIITLTSTPEGSGADAAPQAFVSRVQGAPEKPIDFYVNFNGKSGCAIIRVRYHNYTCEHDIFCREGYEPVVIGERGTEWSSFNVDHFVNGTAVMTTSPLDEGSLFKRNSYIGIKSENTETYPRPLGDTSYAPGAFAVYDADGSTKSKNWNDISYNASANWSINNTDYDVASFYDFEGLKYDDEDINTHKYTKAYGIVYGEESNEVKYNRTDAYGFTKQYQDRGMIGVIVCNTDNANWTFFPIGSSGYGRRKNAGGWGNTDEAGTLRYASRSTLNTGANAQPLFYDIYRRPGAVYWCKEAHQKLVKNPYTGKNTELSSSYEMNFFTMGFEGFQANADKDAIFLRLVKKKK